MASQPLTILHLSDTQFGSYHRFADGLDSLASRLIQDLQQNFASLKIDLVVISGDIAEQGKRSEFAMALSFISQLRGFLGLPVDRVVVVPGNHDVNWDLCRAYFLECAAEDTTPLEPYFPKYRYYLEFLASLYGGSYSETFGLKLFPDLELAIVALDSTRRESHDSHFGFCGEPQLRDMALQLAESTARRRIAVLHHNARRKSLDDNENLRDDDMFTEIVGKHVQLVLHGHTHDGKQDRLSSGTPVLSTGSAAVEKQWRPNEVPNQYQILEFISDTVIRRRGRRYEPDQKRWVSDSRFGEEATPGIEDVPWGGSAQVVLAPAVAASDSSAETPVDFLSQLRPGGILDHAAVARFREDLREGAALDSPGLTGDEFLSRVGLVREGHPTLASLVLLASTPQIYLTSAVTQCVLYFGAEKIADRQRSELRGNAREQVEGAFDWIRARIGRRESPTPTSVQSSTSYAYPMRAIREVLVNAIVHRDYSDHQRMVHVRIFENRIEVASPGSWLGKSLQADDEPLEALESQSVRRNPLLAQALGHIRVFEGEGSGVPVAVADSAQAGAPTPTVRFEDGFVVVTVLPSTFDPGVLRDLRAIMPRVALRTPGTDPRGTSDFDRSRYVEQRLRLTDGSALLAEGFWHLIAETQTPSLILGAGGIGKTTLASFLTAQANLDGVLPVWLSAASFSPGSDTPDSLLGLLTTEWSFHVGRELALGEIHAILTANRTLVIVDGLDELSDAPPVVEELIEQARSFPEMTLVFTSRRNPQVTGGSLSVFRIEPWSLEDLEDFAAKVTTTEDNTKSNYGDRLRAILDESSLSEALFSNPLIGTLILDLVRTSGRGPVSHLQILNSAIDRVIGHNVAKAPPGSWFGSRQLLGRLAMEALNVSEDGMRASKELAIRIIEDESVAMAADLDHQLSVFDPILVALDDNYIFSSRLIRDLLIAERAATQYSSHQFATFIFERTQLTGDSIATLACELQFQRGREHFVLDLLDLVGDATDEHWLSVVRVLVTAGAFISPKQPDTIQIRQQIENRRALSDVSANAARIAEQLLLHTKQRQQP